MGTATGTEVAIMDNAGRLLPRGEEGEIVIRGANVTRGYLDNPAANEAAFSGGWFRTGDLGVLDSDGYLRISGRLKEIINRGGEKISPRQVDEVLLEHPAVAQALAFAVPDARLGEDIAAAVVLRDGCQATAKELRDFAAARLAEFKVPVEIVFLKEIPKGPTGKPQRIGMAERLGLQGRTGATGVRSSEYEAPATHLERLLTSIWSEVLKVERIGVNDDFLALGGDSVLAAQIVARVRDQLQVDLRLTALLEASTVRRQALVVEEAILAELRQQEDERPSRA